MPTLTLPQEESTCLNETFIGVLKVRCCFTLCKERRKLFLKGFVPKRSTYREQIVSKTQ